MNFNIIFSSIMIINAILAGYMAITTWQSGEREGHIKLLTSIVAAGSMLWSLGFGILFLITDFDTARILRAISLAGVFIFLVSMEMLIASFSNLGIIFRYISYMISISGLFIYPFVISEGQALFALTEDGRIYYTITDSASNVIYFAYTLLVTIFCFIYIIDIIRKAPNKRTLMLGRRFLATGILVLLGMLIDTILTIADRSALPLSTITQFYGLLIVLYAFREYDRTKITVKNISEFVYYSLSVPVIIFDSEPKPIIVNDAAYIFLGRDRQQIAPHNMTLEALFDLNSKDMMDDSHMRKSAIADCVVNNANCIITIDPIIDKYNDIVGYIANISDNTDQVNANKRLENAKSDAEASNRSKSAFLANVSHELRTPLNSIMGFTEVLLGSPEMTSEDKEYVADIRTASKSLLAIVDDVQDISKIESGKLELECDSFELPDMVKDIYRIIEPQITAKDILFNTEISPELPSIVYGDSKRLKEIIINLLANAIINTEMGSITLHMSPKVLKDRSSALHIEVSDTGRGYKPEDVDGLFEAFAKADDHSTAGVDGTGLGLALSKRYITLMGGTIYVASTYGVGANFISDIPIQIVDRTPIGAIGYDLDVAALNPEMSKADYGNLSIMIVDDSKMNLKVFSNMLKTYNVEPVCMNNGKEAIASCYGTDYDIIFMDQMMPGMDGVEAMKQIRKISPHYALGGGCHISAFTANAIAGAADSLLSKGFDSYISKPMNVRQLEELLNKVSLQVSPS